jgi:hypothetical protein
MFDDTTFEELQSTVLLLCYIALVTALVKYFGNVSVSVLVATYLFILIVCCSCKKTIARGVVKRRKLSLTSKVTVAPWFTFNV